MVKNKKPKPGNPAGKTSTPPLVQGKSGDCVNERTLTGGPGAQGRMHELSQVGLGTEIE